MRNVNRIKDIIEFYELLDRVKSSLPGEQLLSNLNSIDNILGRGVYFFFESGEFRSESGFAQRVVRVGTHGLRKGSVSTLRNRLKQHRGNVKGKFPGSGNHRGSIFRKHIGYALINKNQYPKKICKYWGIGQNAPITIRILETPIEVAVSQYIRSMPFIWIEINDPAGPDSLRGYVERNSIALLSNCVKPKIDKPSKNWLGIYTNNPAMIESGLWNINHVYDDYDAGFIEKLKSMIKVN